MAHFRLGTLAHAIDYPGAMVVLVTGSAGFIGSHLAERLADRGDRVVGLDNFDAFYPRAIKEANLEGLGRRPAFHQVEGDIRVPADLDRAFAAAGGPVEQVVHLAALAGVRPSLQEPERFYDVNLMGTLRLLAAARRHGVGRVVFASSSSVYGADSRTPFRESDPCARPLSPYAASKRAGELLAWNAHHLDGMGLTCLRFFTAYGPRQRPDLAIHKFTSSLARGEPLSLFGDGTSSRDYTYIDDLIDGVLAAVDQQAADPTPRFRVYNLGGSHATTLNQLVQQLAGAIGRPARVSHLPAPPGEMVDTLADVSLAARELGYAPRVSLSEGLARFVEWWRATEGGRSPARPHE
jgi:UDP-glucuronate 4-epimerase